MWQLAIYIKWRMPEMIMLCDPSHICGKKKTLLEVSQKAADLQYDGLMIESHINPDKALSDARQQVTPADLQILLNSTNWHKNPEELKNILPALEMLRAQIDSI